MRGWVLVVVACSSPEAPRAPTPPRAVVAADAGVGAGEAVLDEAIAEQLDAVLCPLYFDSMCHVDEPRPPLRWSTGAVGLHLDTPKGMALAKLSLEDDRWVGDLWFAPERGELILDETGRARPTTRIASVDTGMREGERRTAVHDAVVGLAYTTDGFVFVAGNVQDGPGGPMVRRFDGTFFRWDAATGRFESTKRLRVTSTWSNLTNPDPNSPIVKMRRAGW